MRIFVVERDPTFRKFLVFALSGGTHQVIGFGSEHDFSKDALPDVVVVSFGHPQMNGMNVLAAARKIGRTATVVIDAGNALDDAKKTLFGVKAMLHKPVDAFELARVVEQAGGVKGTGMLSARASVGSVSGPLVELTPFSGFFQTASPGTLGASVTLAVEVPYEPEPVSLTSVVREVRLGKGWVLDFSAGRESWTDLFTYPRLSLDGAAIATTEFTAKPVRESDAMRLELKGSGDMRVSQAFTDLFKALHNEVIRHRIPTVTVDFRAVEFMNSSCLKAFVVWFEALRALPTSKRYKIRIELNAKERWQERSLQPLLTFGRDALEIRLC